MRSNLSNVARRMTGRGTRFVGRRDRDAARCGGNTNCLRFSANGLANLVLRSKCSAVQYTIILAMHFLCSLDMISGLVWQVVIPGSRIFILSYIESESVGVYSLLRGASSLGGDGIDLQNDIHIVFRLGWEAQSGS
jgi:hypothetical protein